MIAFARMNRILEIDLENERAVVQPGVVNLDITLAVQDSGYFYAPDPSSQRACTIGGNVAENAGGPHTLAYGVTTNHVLGLEAGAARRHRRRDRRQGGRPAGLRSDRPADRLGRHHGAGHQDHRAADAQAGTGEDGCSRSTNRTRTPAAPSPRSPRARITPVAIEMLDGVMLRMVEEATHAGLSDGCRGGAADRAGRHPRGRGGAGGADPRGLRGLPARASSAWRDRPRSATCCGRAARTRSARWAGSARRITCRTAWCRARKIAPTLRFIGEVAQKYGLTISNIFHAGDGNMHPIILFNPRKPGDLEKARARGRGHPRRTASRRAGRSPASTASAWRRTS